MNTLDPFTFNVLASISYLTIVLLVTFAWLVLSTQKS